MELIVLNPVIENLLGEGGYAKLVTLLEDKGYRVEDSKRGIPEVREGYSRHYARVKKSGDFPIVDSRCPEVEHLLLEEFPRLIGNLPPVNPILVTGANIAHSRIIDMYRPDTHIKMIVVTPCKAMAIHQSPWARYITWLEFKEEFGIDIPERQLEESPVPLGYFDPIGAKTYGASGEKGCRELLSNIPADAELLELLWCEGGCHKGDGL